MNQFPLEPSLSEQLGSLLPYLIVGCGGLVVMLVDSFVKNRHKENLFLFCGLVIIGAGIAQYSTRVEPGTLLGGMLVRQGYTEFFNYLFLAIAGVTAIFATSSFHRDGLYRGEFYPLLLFSLLGMMVLVAANDLLALFLGLETMSLATYVLVGGCKGSVRSSEAGFKYLLLGGFASAFLLFGMGLLYGFAGTTSFTGIQKVLVLPHSESWLLAVGVGMMLIGFGFKVAMVPFHMWTPDVYDGAPSYMTGFMATGIKAAAFASLVRLAWVLLPAMSTFWFPLISVLAVLTMTLGNVVALTQSSLKRMLAYSSIAHAGYLLLGLLAVLSSDWEGGGTAGLQEIATAAGGGILFYLVGYTLMNLIAFGIVNFLGSGPGQEADQINRYAGLARRRPWVAAALAISMFSLAGIPPTVGFMGKFYVFEAVVRAGLIPLAIWGVLNSLVSVYYYLNVVVKMYMAPTEEDAYDGTNWESSVSVSFLAGLILLLGVLPSFLHKVAQHTFSLMAF